MMIIKSFHTNINGKYILGNNEQKASIGGKDIDRKDNGSVYTGDLNFSQDKVMLNKVHAQRKALKVLMDTFTSEMSLDSGIDLMKQNITRHEDEALHNVTQKNNILEMQNSLDQEYNISKDSDEYEDLQLLRKERDLKNTNRLYELTQDERDKLDSMSELTAYQKQSLEYDDMINVYQQRADSALSSREGEQKAVIDIGLERLKHDPMLAASKEADEILKNSSKEIIGMLIGDVKEEVDVQINEMKEKIKENEEKSKEEKVKEEKVKDEDNVTESTDNQVRSSDNIESIQKEFEALEIIKKMIDEDIKGIMIDKFL